MISVSLSEISKITQSEIIGNPSVTVNQIQLDSRNYIASQNSVFLAIPGKQKNGHDFIPDLYEKGCRVFWVQKSNDFKIYNDASYIVSANVIEAFQSLVAWYRQLFSMPIVAITGSNGKTIVKEWLYHILKHDYSVVRSPRSYNSQIGVPLSLLLLDSVYDFALIEAGISLPSEMNRLQALIQPTIGVFTNIGDAHQENFSSLEQKVNEKMLLFKDVKKLVYCADYEPIEKAAKELHNVQLFAWSFSKKAAIHVSFTIENVNLTKIIIEFPTETSSFYIPFSDAASIENAIQCFIALHAMGISMGISKYFKDLPPVAMRLEQKAGKNNCTIINDSYNADFQSVSIALQFLSQQKQHALKTIILSDVKQTGIPLEQLYKDIYKNIVANGVTRVIGIGNDITKHLAPLVSDGNFYKSTNEFLLHFSEISFSNESILLKAAREFEFEKIAKKLEFQTHQTVLEINLNAIIHNLQYFKSYLKPTTKVMVMVKAFSYGSGSYEIANVLQHHRADYLAVAFVDEGIELRNAGITMPIVVMNPEIGMLPQLFEYNLEPNIHNFSILQELKQVCESDLQSEYRIHIKIDTGMARYGFSEQDIEQVLPIISSIPNCKIASVFSHLVGSDEERFDEFTKQQIESFKQISTYIQNKCNYSVLRHILNSAGIERFSDAQFDMVRLGIGLYGISAQHIDNCMHISTLKTFISDIREMHEGTTVGYCRNGKILKPSKIAVLPIGYADGLRRKLSNGVGTVIVNNNEVPIIGNICMDATMIDISNCNAEIGDEVILFGEKLPISIMAKKLETIPYEVITSISRRVKRIYYYE